MAGGRLSWMEIISVLFCVCVCVPFVAIISTSLRRGGRNLFGQSSEEDKSQEGWLAGGDWASNKRSFARLRLGRDGGVRRAGGRFVFWFCLHCFFLFTVSVFFVFLIQELVMPFSRFLSLSSTAPTHSRHVPNTDTSPERRRRGREMDGYLPSSRQVRTGQVRTG